MCLNFLSDRFPEFDDSSGSEFIPDSDVSSDTLSAESVTSEVIPVPKHLTRQGKDKQKGESCTNVSKEDCDNIVPSTRAASSNPVADGTPKNKKIMVSMTNNEQKQHYDKIAYCLVCEEPKKDLRTHLMQHKDDPIVATYLAKQDRQARLQLLSRIRNTGNHKHNCNVLKKGDGVIIPVYRPNYEANHEDYQPCSNCLGWYSKCEMWKHSCPVTGERKCTVREGRQLKPTEHGHDTLFDSILACMRGDAVGRCVKSDPLINEFGRSHTNKLGHDKDSHNQIRTELRSIGRLVLKYRETSRQKGASLSSMLGPREFLEVTAAVRELALFDTEKHAYAKPTLGLKLGHCLKKAALINVNKALMEGDQALEERSRNFLTLYTNKWAEEVSTHALRSMYDGKRNNPKLLPLTSDVVKMSNFIKEESVRFLQLLVTGNEEDKENAWKELNKLCLAHVILFNRRRQGEVAKMTMEDYAHIKKGTSHVMEDISLQGWEKQLIGMMWRVEVVGKRGRTVPLMLTTFRKSCIDELVKNRSVSRCEKNAFLFARPHCESHIRGCDVIREISMKCGASKPDLLRSTSLRKHIATMCQIMSLSENELDILSNYLGHDIRVHRAFYRLPDPTLQVAKLSKLILAMEGNAGQPATAIRCKTLDDIQIHMDEGLLRTCE